MKSFVNFRKDKFCTMNFSSPKNISLIIATSLAIVTGILSAFSNYIDDLDFWKYLIIEILIAFIFSYLIVFYAVKKILLKKITPIYKIIEQTEAFLTDSEEKFYDKNIIEETNKDVEIWAKLKTREIEKLRKLEKYRREFLGNVSHELKTPIFNVQGYISTLLDGGLHDEKINQKYLERAEQSINRLISIVQDLESISKLESGELEIKKENFNIVQLVKEVVEILEMRALQKNIKIQISFPEKPVSVYADRLRITEVLNNLIVNSIIYGIENGKTTIKSYDMDDRILIEITDNGIGIEEKYLPRLFERFFRVDKSRSSELGGTGLGLAIAKHILEVHNQTIHVKSKPGSGSSFSFTLQKSIQ
jgi:two-component system, OmpR family, phosphate regulon sensor histidine kinase PhoR